MMADPIFSKRVHPTDALLRYVDDEQMPADPDELRRYLLKARSLLLDEVVRTYVFIREKGLSYEYMSWCGRRELPDGHP